ncbi:MAG: GNAT family N-acetyltransferase [Oscillospiraceae bacterium]|jgi:putative acetyltransferase|nr:GNAT family N-acetyltransferase [Oscillospiraceae bacterium]
MKTLKSARLILRDWRIGDAGDFFEYAKSPNVGPNAGWKPHGSILESEKIIGNFLESGDVWAIEHRELGKVIGSFGLHFDATRKNPEARMIGYTLSEDFWGNGYMPEAVGLVLKHAFCELLLNIITVQHFPFNDRSRRVIEKCGFTYEGTLRRAVMIYNGNVYDSVSWSMTREEYLALNSD